MSNHPLFGNPSLRRLCNEYLAIRNNNAAARNGEHGRGEASFAEGTLLLVLVERFLRVLLGSEASDQTLPGLLQLAMSDRLDLLDPPIFFPHQTAAESQAFAIQVVVRVRNPLLHGNYEQAANDCQPGMTVEDYFAGGSYRIDLDDAHNFFESMLVQFDRESGKRLQMTRRRREIEDAQWREARQRFVNRLSIRALRATRGSPSPYFFGETAPSKA